MKCRTLFNDQRLLVCITGPSMRCLFLAGTYVCNSTPTQLITWENFSFWLNIETGDHLRWFWFLTQYWHSWSPEKTLVSDSTLTQPITWEYFSAYIYYLRTFWFLTQHWHGWSPENTLVHKFALKDSNLMLQLCYIHFVCVAVTTYMKAFWNGSPIFSA
jgi:hypothetical protein